MRKLAIFLASLFFLLVLVVALVPPLASTDWGKNLILKTAGKITGASIEIDTLELSWFSKQDIRNLQIKTQDGALNASCPELSSSAPLWQILVKHNLGSVTMLSPQIEISQSALALSLPARTPMKKRVSGFFPSIAATLPQMTSFSGDFKIENGSLVMGGFEIGELSLACHLFQNDPISLTASGKTFDQNEPGTFSIQGLLSDPAMTLQINMTHFPVATIDQIISLSKPEMRGMLTELIGNSLSVQIDFQSTPSTMEAALLANSSQIKLSAKTEIAGDAVILSKPASLTVQLTPALLQKLFRVDVIAPVTAAIQIADFSMPIARKEAFRFAATISSTAVADIDSFSISVATENFSEKVFEVGVNSPQLQISSLKIQLQDGLRLLQPVTFSGVASGEITKLNIPEEWQKLDLAFFATLPQGKITLTADTIKHIDGTFTLAQFPLPLPPLLTEAVAIPFNLTDLDVDTLRAQGTIRLPVLPLKEYPVTSIDANFKVDGKQKKLETTFAGNIASGSLDLNLSIQNEIYDIKGSIDKIPTHFFELWLPDQTKLQQIFGSQISSKLQLHSEPQMQSLSFQTSSDLLDGELSLIQKDGFIQLEKSSKLSYTLTKEAYAAIDAKINTTPAPFALTKPALIKISLSKLSMPVTATENRIPDVNFSPTQFQIEASGAVDDLSFIDTLSNQETKVTSLSLLIEKQSAKAPLAFKLDGNLGGRGLMRASGSYEHDSQLIAFDSEITQFPTQVVDLLIRALGKGDLVLTTIVGPIINATAKAKILDHTGPLMLNVNTPNARISIDGNLTKGNMTLNDTIYAQLKLTPELSKILLKDVNPLSVSAMRADAPLTLEIPADGFSVFMYPFIPSQMNIPKARIELGQIYCQNEGNLNIAMSLLKLSQFARDKELKVWFAPIDLHINSGVVDCERTEILVADAYQICTWGSVDLVKDYVEMVLGLTSSCLKKAFGIKNLPEKYVLQIPMTGPTNDVSINTTSATAKIAALLLWQQKAIAGGYIGGPAGALVGEFLNKLGPLPDEKSDTPAPKHPFPWESEPPPPKTDDTPRKNKTHLRGTEKPLKQILKLIK